MGSTNDWAMGGSWRFGIGPVLVVDRGGEEGGGCCWQGQRLVGDFAMQGIVVAVLLVF